MQKIGLKYHEDFLERIPRDEVTLLSDKVTQAVASIFKSTASKINIVTAGSYRRGRETCGDIDILITRKDD